MHGRTWTDDDVTFLRENYLMLPIGEIVDVLGRSASSIRNRAAKLGLRKMSDSFSEAVRTRYDRKLLEINRLSIDDVPINVAFKHANWIRRAYVDDELSEQDIADITGCTRKNIEYWLRKYGIERRDNITSRTDLYRAKISETSKGRVPFSKGLTKYDHPSIMLISEKLRGEKAPNWKGGKYVSNSGYMFISSPSHPYRDKDNYVLEHRLVMESIVGRYLLESEVVHHKDFNRLNNAPENLFLFPSNRSHHCFHMYKKHVNPSVCEERFLEEVYEECYPISR